MSEENNLENESEELNGAQENAPEELQNAPEEKPANFVKIYIALGCLVAGVALLVTSFFIKNYGVYLLISSLICDLAAISFLNAQKRTCETAAVKVLIYVTYAVMVAGVAVFAIGLGFNASSKK